MKSYYGEYCSCDMILQNGVKSNYGWVDLLELYHSGVTWRRYCVPSSITIVTATVTWKRSSSSHCGWSLRGVVVVQSWCNCNVVKQWRYNPAVALSAHLSGRPEHQLHSLGSNLMTIILLLTIILVMLILLL